MTDDVKKAMEWLRTLLVPGWPACDHATAILTHLDAEPERLAAAREEQREAVRARLNTLGSAATRTPADLGLILRIVDGTPLTATPRADRIKELEAQGEVVRRELAAALERVDRDTADWVDLRADSDRMKAERDAALERVKELEADQHCPTCGSTVYTCVDCDVTPLTSQRDALKAQIAEATADGTLSARIGAVREALGMNEFDSATEVGAVLALKAQINEAVEALTLAKHRDMADGSPCWCLLWLDEEPEITLAHEGHGDHCTAARAFLAKYPEGR